LPPLPQRPFPTSSLTQVWSTVIGWLKRDPILHAAVDTWQVWDGSSESTDAPTEESLPLIRITPATGGGFWLDENSHELTLSMTIYLAVEGTDITLIFDFWMAVMVALFTGNTLLNQLYAFSVISKTMTAPAFSPPRPWGEKAAIDSTATLQVRMRVNS
jgi:hypothetical protein